MALTGTELIDEIQSLVGRSSADPLVDDTRCTRWLNEAQRIVVENCPGAKSVSFKNTTSLDTTQVLQYDVTDITVGDSTTQEVCHLFNVFYLDGNESRRLTFVHQDDFDEDYPDPTHSDYTPDRPDRWILRGKKIEIFPLCATAYCDKNLRFDGDFYPEDFTTNDGDYSDLSMADSGLIFYSVGQAWGAIGDEAKSILWETKFRTWLDEYNAKAEVQQAWDGNLLGDAINQ